MSGVSIGGGKGANQALASTRAGAEVRFVTMLGNDPGGDAYRLYLVERGLSPDGILRCKASTGAALILVDGKGENQIAVAQGANALLTPGRMRRKPGLLDYGDVVLAQLEVPVASVMAAFERGKRRGARNVLNPAPAAGELPDELLRLTDVLAPNETEAAHLAGLGEIPETDEEFLRAAHALRDLGPSQVVITAGEKGAFLLDEKGASWMRPPPEVEAVDTTGAGDAFLRRAGGETGRGRGVWRSGALRRQRRIVFGEKTWRTGWAAFAQANPGKPAPSAPKTNSGWLTSIHNPHRVRRMGA